MTTVTRTKTKTRKTMGACARALAGAAAALAVLAAGAEGQGAMQAAPTPVDEATRRAVATAAADLLEASYVKPRVGAEMAELLRRRSEEGAWSGIDDARAFARTLTSDLNALAHDLHLVVVPPGGREGGAAPGRVVVRRGGGEGDGGAVRGGGEEGAGAAGPGRRVVRRPPGEGDADAARTPVRRDGTDGAPSPSLLSNPRGLPASFRLPPDPSPEMLARAEEMLGARVAAERAENHYLKGARVLPGNVGYLDLDRFPLMPHAAPTVDAAMEFLAHVDAFILDLRGNPGGAEGLNQYLNSFFFGDEPVHLYSRFYAEEDTTREYWTLPDAPPVELSDVPLFVLTDGASGSAAENTAFALQNTGRAILVGETTAGAGHSSRTVDLPAGFSMVLPMARVFDPRTDRDFQGSGVVPDVRVASRDALTRAHELAVAALAERSDDPRRRQELEQAAVLFRARSGPPPSEAELQGLEGTYGNRRVWMEDGRLMLVRTDVAEAPELELLHLGDDRFVLEALPQVRVEFVRGEDGLAERVRLLNPAGQWEEVERGGR